MIRPRTITQTIRYGDLPGSAGFGAGSLTEPSVVFIIVDFFEVVLFSLGGRRNMGRFVWFTTGATAAAAAPNFTNDSLAMPAVPFFPVQTPSLCRKPQSWLHTLTNRPVRFYATCHFSGNSPEIQAALPCTIRCRGVGGGGFNPNFPDPLPKKNSIAVQEMNIIAKESFVGQTRPVHPARFGSQRTERGGVLPPALSPCTARNISPWCTACRCALLRRPGRRSIPSAARRRSAFFHPVRT